MAASAAENVLLQGYAVTGTAASEQAIVTQGYAAMEAGPTGEATYVRFRSRWAESKKITSVKEA